MASSRSCITPSRLYRVARVYQQSFTSEDNRGFVGRILEHVRYLTSIPVPMLCDMMEYQYQDMPEFECIARILELEYSKIARGLYLPINISCRLGNPESGTDATRAATIELTRAYTKFWAS